MFRAERDACLLVFDAVRDGVDVSGDSLRLIVLDQVPGRHRDPRTASARPSATRPADMVVRLRLRRPSAD
jgi:Rad3-related DNA helicase